MTESNNFNKDELTHPDWLNEALFAKAIGSFEHDPNVKIKTVKFMPATQVGDHFTSVMFRVTVVYDIPKYKKLDVNRVLIVKILPTMEGLKTDLFKDSPLFKTEMRMYSQVLPEMERILSVSGDETKLCPRLIYQTTDPEPIIILEDISVFGFEMSPKPVDYETALKIASKLAKFHATSMHIQSQGGDLTSFTDAIMLSPVGNGTFIDMYVLTGFQMLLEEMKEWEGYESVVEKLKMTISKFNEQMKNVYTGMNDKLYSVLTHCDFHYKNIMFQKTEGKYDELLFLDFQCCLWGTPAIDVHYLLHIMINFEARKKRLQIIKFYYDEFEATLKKIGYMGKIPSLLDLNLELLKNGAVELLLALNLSAWQFMDFTDTNADEILEMSDKSMDMARKLFKNPEYQKIIKAEIPRFMNMGLLG